MRRIAAAFLVVAGIVGRPAPSAAEPGGVTWLSWSPETFARAKAEGCIVLVEVSAAWCHWCHVMERETYGDRRVAARIAERFLPVKVDADARPDLAERFAEYHWPATVFLTPDGRTVTALRGYRDPEEFLAILSQVLDAVRAGRTLDDVDPPGGRGVAAASGDESFLAPLRVRLEAILRGQYDGNQGGWGFGQKYPFPGPLEHALVEARLTGDPAWRSIAERVLAQQESLIDPVWGGMYQYSEGGVWTQPHFEKIMAVNAGAMSNYAIAFATTRDERWARDAEAIRRYLVTFLRSPSGAFYTSQDADVGAHSGNGDAAEFVDGHDYFPLDDAGRRARGMPRIDAAVYAQENGWAIRALCRLYAATRKPAVLDDAKRAAEAIVSTHRDARGGFRHAATDGGVFYLGDQVAMGHALLALADVTGEARWRGEAAKTADFLLAALRDAKRGGFLAHTDDPTAVGVFRERMRPFEANAGAARFLLALHAATDHAPYRTEALRALQAISDAGLGERFGGKGGDYLVAVEEAIFPWLAVTVVGPPGAAAEAAMWAAALDLQDPFTIRERVAPGGASVLGATYPKSPRTVAFVCGRGRCSDPVADPSRLAETVRSFRAR